MFNYYCDWNKSARLNIEDHIDDRNPVNTKLSFKNFKLDDNLAKAIVCILPFMLEINEVELLNNQVTDTMSGALTMACFANPSVSRLNISYNYLRNSFARTF